ncbi:uncharacterized protein [Aegilops tauschii subsp. strangulata]|uniref:uncharacterized protein isoform X2 n=2 Tax=Aegilops tauschii subsp. strangulata TaxID=200361 RepID=UPI00098B69EE|nr:uncharacterized protein LOC109756671 isoform X2 [Aegilops tauschii subsp. strangulata]
MAAIFHFPLPRSFPMEVQAVRHVFYFSLVHRSIMYVSSVQYENIRDSTDIIMSHKFKYRLQEKQDAQVHLLYAFQYIYFPIALPPSLRTRPNHCRHGTAPPPPGEGPPPPRRHAQPRRGLPALEFLPQRLDLLFIHGFLPSTTPSGTRLGRGRRQNLWVHDGNFLKFLFRCSG